MERKSSAIYGNLSLGDDQKEKAKLKLIDIRNKLISGENFEILATLNSEDFESAKRGGRIGFVGRGVLQPEYEEASLKLNPGEISMPVETKFGFHLIELIEKRGNMYDTTIFSYMYDIIYICIYSMYNFFFIKKRMLF